MAIYPISQGSPDYSSSGTTKFIPEVFSGKTQVKFYKKSIVPAISNTDWEGEISKMGDKVNIRTIASVTGGSYSKGQAIKWIEPKSDSIQLVVDKGHYFAIKIDDVNEKQMDIDMMTKWQEDAAQQTKIGIDADVLQTIYADVPAENQGATAGNDSSAFNLGTTGAPLAITRANILQAIIDAGTVLDEQSVPEDRGWWLALPPWAIGLIKQSDLNDAAMTGDSKSIIRSNGRIGMIDRFEIYNSRLLATNGTYTRCMFGSRDALTFASQLTETKTVDFENTFGRGIKGLTVYGYKVVKPEALGMIVASKG